MSKAAEIKSQAVIVVTLMKNGVMFIRTDNDTNSGAAEMADAIVKLSMNVLKSDKKTKDKVTP